MISFFFSSLFPVNNHPTLSPYTEHGVLLSPFVFTHPDVHTRVCVCVCARSLPCGWRLQSAPLHRSQWRTVTTKFSLHQMSATPVPLPLLETRTRYRRTVVSVTCRTSSPHWTEMASLLSKELCILFGTEPAA